MVIVPPPAITDHVPMPTIGLLAFNVVVGLLIHSVWLGPAFAIVGTC